MLRCLRTEYCNREKSLKTIAFFVALLIPFSAQALLIGPGDAIDSGPETSNSAIRAVLASDYGLTEIMYKADVDGDEEGTAAGEYHTVFSNSASDPSDADIIWDGVGYIDGATHMVVKDGQHDPGWYLFDISGWDGMETIQLRGFWPNGGAISHVAIYGGVHVPEPGTLSLLGIGLLGIGLLRRKSV